LLGKELTKEEVEQLMSRFFTYVLSYEDERVLEYIVEPHQAVNLDEAFSSIYDEVVSKGFSTVLIKHDNMLLLRFAKRQVNMKSKLQLTLMLFIATIASVAITGYYTILSYNESVSLLNLKLGLNIELFDPVVGTILFVGVVLTPLMAHELSHYVTNLRLKVPTTTPLPIPAPFISPLGTFGAVIQIRHLPKNLKDLALMGISGPLAGVTFSIIAYLIGYVTSPTLPLNVVSQAIESNLISMINVAPLSALAIDALLTKPTEVVILNPIALSAYLILIVHFANLLPIGQLDGGHVFRALTSVKTHSTTSLIVALAGITVSLAIRELTWLGVFSVIALLISGRGPHFGAANTLSVLNSRDKRFITLLYLLLLTATFPVVII